MNESTSLSKVYEISYLLVPSLPEERVVEQTAALYTAFQKYSATVIAEEAPSLISLAYEMDKSSGGGSHQRFDKGYFGWVKFTCSPSVVEDVRKSFEQNPYILRALAISTVKEKTYLGKRIKSETKSDNKAEEKQVKAVGDEAIVESEPAAIVAAVSMTPAEIAAVDKQLDEIVKGA